MRLHTMVLALAILAAGTVISAAAAAQAGRHIHVNDIHLPPDYILLFDQLVGAPVPDGAYWADFQTGLWGAWDGEGAPFVVGRADFSAVVPPADGSGGGGGGGSFRDRHGESILSRKDLTGMW